MQKYPSEGVRLEAGQDYTCRYDMPQTLHVLTVQDTQYSTGPIWSWKKASSVEENH